MIYVLPLSFTRPPLMSNQRKHWSHRSRMTRALHDEIGWQLKAKRVPALIYPTVSLHWVPSTIRRRDADGPIPTSKACLDALVVHRKLTDDTSAHVNHLMPVIEPVERTARLWFQIETP